MEGSAGAVSRIERRRQSERTGSVRGHVGVQQDMAVLEVLHVRARLEVFLQRVAPLVGEGAEGSLVDGAGHGGWGDVSE